MKDRKVKQVLRRDGYQWEFGRLKGVKEGKSGGSTLHICVNIEQ
jgi:hypothetical protein